MAELAHRQPLVAPAFAPADTDLAFAPSPCAWAVQLQAHASSAGTATELAGLALPQAPNTAAGTDPVALWLAPRRWLIVASGTGAGLGAMLDAAARAGVAACDASDGFFRVRLAGALAPELLAAGCALDLHARVFAPAACARTRLARTTLLLHRRENHFDLYFERSVADYAWRWLQSTARALLAARGRPI
jgi:sarcosine oxidase subunit gamma